MSSTPADDDVQVLEFRLGDETYCVGIEYVAEIVEGGELTSIPNAATYVEGLMDLRGRTTTIINPFAVLETEGVDSTVTDGGTGGNRIVILDPDVADSDGAAGWLVSAVDEVTTVAENDLETDVVADSDVLRGVIRDDEGFTLWVDPHEMTA